MAEVKTAQIGVGTHLLLDGHAPVKPTNEVMRKIIDACVNFIELKIIHGPVFFALDRYDEAWVIIAESHISVKGFHDGVVLVDVFSCKPFDAPELVSIIEQMLNLSQSKYQVLNRTGTG